MGMDICTVSTMPQPVNRCRLCGATSYRRVIERDERGMLVAGSRYSCSGCSVSFGDPRAWRQPAIAGLDLQHARTMQVRRVGAEESPGRTRLNPEQAILLPTASP